jgi:hypothetical protein
MPIAKAGPVSRSAHGRTNDEEVDEGDGYIGFKEFIVWWKSELAALVSSSRSAKLAAIFRVLGN